MRLIVTAITCIMQFFACSDAEASSSAQAALITLEAKAQSLADHYDPAVTSFADVETALGVTLQVSDGDEPPCDLPQCFVWKFTTPHAPFEYYVRVSGVARDAKGEVPSLVGRDLKITITLTDDSRDLCFSETEWATQLTNSGWAPLQPFTIDLAAWGPDGENLPDLHQQGFAARRSAAYVTLKGADMSGIHGWADTAKLANLQMRQSCMKTVIIGRSPLDYRRSRGTLNVLDAETQAEFDELQPQLQKVVADFKTASDIHVLEAGLGSLQYSVDQPCTATCQRMFEAHLGELAPLNLLLYQVNNSVDSISANAFSWKAEHSFMDVTLDSEAAAGLCFSLTGWNEMLTKAGWVPLKPFAITRKAYGEFDMKARNSPKTEIAVSGYATKRGTTYMTLATAGNSAEFLGTFHDQADFDRLQVLGTCLRSVTVGDSLPVKDAYDLANGLPRPNAPE